MLPTEVLIPIAVFIAVAAAGGIVIVLTRGDKRVLDTRLEQIRTNAVVPAEVEEGPSALSSLLSRIGGLPILGAPSAKLKQTLTRAGFNQRGSAELFFGIKLLVLIAGFCASLVAVIHLETSLGMGATIVVAGAFFMSMIPNFFLNQRVKKRTTDIRCALPNAIDLLEVCVSAGMGVDQAWNSTADEMVEASQALADEMQLVNLEMLLGARRPEALKNMANRSGAEDLSSLSSIISQADKFGTSVADALRTFAETMRETRSVKAEEAAEKMAIKLLLPMVIFIFPVVLLVSAGPAALKMVELLG